MVTFCGCRQKVTRHQGEIHRSAAGKAHAARKRTPHGFRVSARAPTPAGQILRCAQDDSKKTTAKLDSRSPTTAFEDRLCGNDEIERTAPLSPSSWGE